MLTVSDFIRWLRKQVIETPDVAGYEITLMFDADNTREETEDWFVDHQNKQVVIVGRDDASDEDSEPFYEASDDDWSDDE